MLRRCTAPLLAVGLAAALMAPASAAGTLVKQISTKRAPSVTLTAGLLGGHRYRIYVRSASKRPFTATAFENYVLIANHSLKTASKGLTVKGTTPGSFLVRQQLSGSVQQWTIGLTVALGRGTGLTVKIVDKGKAK